MDFPHSPLWTPQRTMPDPDLVVVVGPKEYVSHVSHIHRVNIWVDK